MAKLIWDGKDWIDEKGEVVRMEQKLNCPSCGEALQLESVRTWVHVKDRRCYWECGECGISIVVRDKGESRKRESARPVNNCSCALPGEKKEVLNFPMQAEAAEHMARMMNDHMYHAAYERARQNQEQILERVLELVAGLLNRYGHGYAAERIKEEKGHFIQEISQALTGWQPVDSRMPPLPCGCILHCDAHKLHNSFMERAQREYLEAAKYLHEAYLRSSSTCTGAWRGGVRQILQYVGMLPKIPVGKLTLEEARASGRCRICGEPKKAPFTLNFGHEFAHTACYENATRPEPGTKQSPECICPGGAMYHEASCPRRAMLESILVASETNKAANCK